MITLASKAYRANWCKIKECTFYANLISIILHIIERELMKYVREGIYPNTGRLQINVI